MTELLIAIAWTLGTMCGYFMGITAAGRRSFIRENTSPPSGPPPLKLRRTQLPTKNPSRYS